jgi:hypothetical protein
MTATPPMLTVYIPLTVHRRGGRKVVIAPDGTEAPVIAAARIDSTLVKALARAFRWRRMLESGVVSTVGEIAVREKINKSYVSRVLRLTLLAPDIVEAILDGRQPEAMTLVVLLQRFPVEWEQQTTLQVAVNGLTKLRRVGRRPGPVPILGQVPFWPSQVQKTASS